MAEWFVEEGIGEDRAIRLEGGEIIAARVDWPGTLAAGQVEAAVLISRTSGSKRGTLRFAGGEEALVDNLPATAGEGTGYNAEVTRAAIAEKGRNKRAQARLTTAPPRPAPSLTERLRGEGHAVRIVRRFPACGWEDLFDEAWNGTIAFAGGSLTITPTPAMTLIDVDGTALPPSLAKAAVPVIAGAIRRLDLAGSIGIDFPTLADRSDRRALDESLAAALADWPHQATAMNGFGFVQLVARLERPSLLHRFAQDRSGAAARALLRRAEGVNEAGTILLTAHPAVRSATQPAWEAELARRTGRKLRWQEEPALALAAGFAQAVAS